MVTIIIPAYNCEKTISRCIDSLIMQTYKDIEIIVVDDGSLDNTYDIIKRYSHIDNRIIPLKQKNGGPGAARNTGMKFAKGTYFTFVDADDTVEKDYVEKMVVVAKKFKLELVISDIHIYGKKKKFKNSQFCNVISGKENIKSQIIPLIKNGRLNAPFAKLYNLNIQRENNVNMPTNIDIGEDLQFNLAYIQNVSKIGILDVKLYTYYTCNSMLTKKFRINEYDLREKNIKGMQLFLNDNGIDDVQFISYLYLKLMYAECMNMRRYLKKEDRLNRIKVLLTKEEIQKAIKTLKPKGIIQYLVLFGLKTGDCRRIDFIAYIFNVGKLLGNSINRESV